MAQYVAFPPHQIHSVTLVSNNDAQILIAEYLDAASNDASLHPNALLTEAGPVSSNQGENLGLVLHNLKRVEAGLRGEHLAPELDLTAAAGAEENTTDADGLGAPEHMDGIETKGGATIDNQDWQDKSDFEREQEEEQGEIGAQISATRVQDASQIPEYGGIDKEERKKKKKEKRKADQKAKLDKAQRAKEMDVESDT